MSKAIDRVDARDRLTLRRDPYWKRLSEGRYIGFRKMTKGSAGTWLARIWNPDKPPTKKRKEVGGYDYDDLGDFADLAEKDRYGAALAKAQEWFGAEALRPEDAPRNLTVKGACEAYIAKVRTKADRKERPDREAAARDMESRLQRWVYDDPIAKIEVAKLKRTQVEAWKSRVLSAGIGESSFNREATPLRASLNDAHKAGAVPTKQAWLDPLSPFKGAGTPGGKYLTPEIRRKIIDAASEEAKPLFHAMNLLPMRPSELAKCKVENFDATLKTLHVPMAKTKARDLFLSGAAVSHFKQCAKDKLPGAWLIARADGSQWKKEAWKRAMREASVAAKLPRQKLKWFRHSAITDLLTGGLDAMTVARLAGTSLQMIQKTYGHLLQAHAVKALEKLARMA